MPVYVTYHRAQQQPGGLPVLGPQIGDRDTLAVSAEAANGTTQTYDVLARIFASEAACILVGAGAVAVGTEGEVWGEGADDVRYLPAGSRVSVISVA